MLTQPLDSPITNDFGPRKSIQLPDGQWTIPSYWVQERAWKFSAQPGWVDAYKYAVDSGDEEPGANEGAITDGMILSAVQALMAEEQE